MVKEMRDQMDICRRDLKKLRSQRDVRGIQSYNHVRWEYMCLLEKEEVYLKQRAKQYWLHEGDKSSRFFHKFASTKI